MSDELKQTAQRLLTARCTHQPCSTNFICSTHCCTVMGSTLGLAVASTRGGTRYESPPVASSNKE